MRLTRGKKKETVARRGPATEEGPRPGGLEKENMDADSIREMFAASLSHKIDNKTNTQQANARTGTSPGTVTSDDPTKTEMKDEEGVGVRPGRFFDASRLLEVELKIERVRFGPMVRLQSSFCPPLRPDCECLYPDCIISAIRGSIGGYLTVRIASSFSRFWCARRRRGTPRRLPSHSCSQIEHGRMLLSWLESRR